MVNRVSLDIMLDENSQYWFSSPYIRKRFRKNRYLVELEKGEILVNAGEELPDCYYVDEGIIISYSFEGNNRRVFDFYDKGMFVFLEETQLDYQSGLTYEALTPVKLYSISTEYVKRLWKTDERFIQYSMKQMSRDYMVMRSLIMKETLHSATWRVATILMELSLKEGIEKEGKIYLSKKHKKIYLSNLLHMNRVTFYKSFMDLQDRGYLAEDGGRIVVLDWVKLKAYRDSLEK